MWHYWGAFILGTAAPWIAPSNGKYVHTESTVEVYRQNSVCPNGEKERGFGLLNKFDIVVLYKSSDIRLILTYTDIHELCECATALKNRNPTQPLVHGTW